MPERSRYDELHDYYQAISTTKKGTRYERLAAVVFAALDRSSVVIHDLKVIGSDTGAKHQIDVTIEKDGKAKRILVECKDFDVSGKSVGLEIVTRFWGVVDDIHPDESWVITCNSFTAGARKYAKGKGIKLATLRAFAEADWENRIQTIETNLTIVNVGLDRPDVRVKMSDEDGEKFKTDWMRVYPKGGFTPEDDQTQLFDGETVRSFSEIARALGETDVLENDLTQLTDGAVVNGWVSIDGTNRYKFEGYSITVPITRTTQTFTLSAVRDGAKLLLTDGNGLDFILWDTTLKAFAIESDGSVTLSPDAVQKKLITTVSAPVHH